jgi:hypothetical protein
MKSVFYQTVRHNSAGQPVKEPVFLNHTNRLSIFKDRNQSNGLDLRLNGVGDTADSATGYQIVIDTLTYIKKQVSEQKFYEVAPADFIPVSVGDGAFAANILTNRTYQVADDFESGNIRTGADSSRLAGVDVAIDSKTMAVINWAKSVDYSIFDIEQALVANNWDPIEQKHRSRKKNWDLGIQKIAFLGSTLTPSTVPGLFTTTSVNTDTSTIQKLISSMSASEFSTFVQNVLAVYFANTNSTVLPTSFIIPYDDYLGLMTPVSSTYPNIPKLNYLEQAFKAICGPNFKILPNAYGTPANNAVAGLNKHVYCLLRYDPESIRMDIPVDYTTTQPNSVNNFQFQDVAYGQYTGVGFYRALETLLFTF